MESNKVFTAEIINPGTSCPPDNPFSDPHDFREIEKGIWLCKKCGCIIKTKLTEVSIDGNSTKKILDRKNS